MYRHIQNWNLVGFCSKCWALNKRQLVRRQLSWRFFDKNNWDQDLRLARSLYVSSVRSKAKTKIQKSKHNIVKLWFISCFYYCFFMINSLLFFNNCKIKQRREWCTEYLSLQACLYIGTVFYQNVSLSLLAKCYVYEPLNFQSVWMVLPPFQVVLPHFIKQPIGQLFWGSRLT